MAGHWAAAGRTAEELPARVRAAEAAERVFGYAEAARHWQRAIELFEQVPDPEQLAGMDLPQLYLRCLDALRAVGDASRGGVLAEEAYRRFADHPDPAVAASVHLRARVVPIGQVRRLTRARCSSRRCACSSRCHHRSTMPEAWFAYAEVLFLAEGQGDARRAALTRGLEVAEAAGATGVAAGIQLHLAHDACLRGQVAEGLAIVERARALAEASGDGEALVEVAARRERHPAQDRPVRPGSRGGAARRAGRPRERPQRPTSPPPMRPRRCSPGAARPRRQS